MKHFSGSVSGGQSVFRPGRPSDSSRNFPRSAPNSARQQAKARPVALITSIGHPESVQPQPDGLVRPVAGELHPAAAPRAVPAPTPTRPQAPHRAARLQKPPHNSSSMGSSSRQLQRMASHSIDVGSDLSSSDSEAEPDQNQQTRSMLAPPATAAAAADLPPSLRQRKQGTQQRKPQHPTPAAAGAGAPPSTPKQARKSRMSQGAAGSALSAVACLVLLVAFGGAVRAVYSWQRGAWHSSSSTSKGHTPAAAAAASAGAGAAAFEEGVFSSSSSSSSWLASLFQPKANPTRHQRSHPLGPTPRPAAAPSPSSTPSTAAKHSSSSGSNSPTATRAAATTPTTPTGSSSGGSSDGSNTAAGGRIRLYAVVDAAAASPFRSHSPQGSKGLDWSASWGQVLQHMAQRLAWTDPRFDLQVITQEELKSNPAARDTLAAALSSSSSSSSTTTPQMFIGIGITDPDVAAFLTQATAQLPTALFWNSAPSLSSSSRVDGYAPAAAGPLARLLAQHVGFSREGKAAEVMRTLEVLWGRNTSDDLLYIWLVLLNQYVTPVPMVANTTKGTDLASLYCMVSNCGQKIVDCVSDKTCKAGLDCLQGCAFNDQVCQYRCIVSYETPQFEQFALCILQLHNCRGLNAQIPPLPDPAPMTTWRGQALTHEAAEDLFIGWLSQGPQIPQGGPGLKPYSWLVAAGKNPAYDAFGCQHQLYYRGKGKGQLWYEPVFRVTTLEGQEVWRKRRYRVRRGSTPGTFHYSVLDNGVTSNEYWRIIDCAEDLTYCLFYYSGAASAAGLSYTGAVLGTRDGLWPGQYTERIHGALRQAGIEPWELSMPDNSRCADAPLTAAAAA